jgi:Uma2 family endonuclease
MAEPILAPDPATTQPVDRELFSLHPEEQRTERPSHRLQGNYLARALRRLLPEWFVAANMGVYWMPGELEYPYVGPDVLVARNRPSREDAAVYLTYEDGPLTLVVEIASPATRNLDRHKRDTDYAVELAVPWYLWIDRPRHVLELYRLIEGRHELVSPDAEGRVWCTEPRVGFTWQADGRLVRVLGADGTVVATEDEEQALLHEETARRQTAEERAEREARRAEREARRAEREAQRAAEEAAARRSAEQQAEQEAAARLAAEQKAEALAAELDRLRRALRERQGGPE